MESIAIIGLAFKLPQDVEDEQSFWEVLEQGKSLMTEWPASRVNVNAFARSQDTSLNVVCNLRVGFLDATGENANVIIVEINTRSLSKPRPRQLRCALFRDFRERGVVNGSRATNVVGNIISCPREW